MKQKQMFFWNSLAFSMSQQILAIWSLVPLPFLNPARTSGSSQFTYCQSLAWRILSITLFFLSATNVKDGDKRERESKTQERVYVQNASQNAFKLLLTSKTKLEIINDELWICLTQIRWQNSNQDINIQRKAYAKD